MMGCYCQDTMGCLGFISEHKGVHRDLMILRACLGTSYFECNSEEGASLAAIL